MGIIQGGDPLSKDPAQAARYGTGGLGELRFEANAEKHDARRGRRGARARQARQRRRPVLHLHHRSAGARRAVHGIRAGRRGHQRRAEDLARAGGRRRHAGRARRHPHGDDPRQAGAGAGAVRAPKRPRSSAQYRAIDRDGARATSRSSSCPTGRRTTCGSSCGWRRPASTMAPRSIASLKGFVVQGGYLQTRSEPLDERQERLRPAAAAGVQRHPARPGHRLDGPRRRSGQRDHARSSSSWPGRRRSTTSTRRLAESSREWTWSRRWRRCRSMAKHPRPASRSRA